MSKPVFTIIQEYDTLINEIEELSGEITPEIAAKLIINEKELATKIRAYYFIIKTKEAEINLAKEEQERLDAVKKTKENLIKRLKKTVDLAVETFGVLKPSGVKGLDLGDLKVWQKKTDALNITGEIDDERFCNKKITFNVSYTDAITLLDIIHQHEVEGTSRFVANISIDILKDQLKQWLIDNEENLEIAKGKFIDAQNRELTDFDNEESHNTDELCTADVKITCNASINHNNTVIFK